MVEEENKKFYNALKRAYFVKIADNFDSLWKSLK